MAQLKTGLLTPSGPRRVRIEAIVAWANGDFLGLSFARTSDAVVKALGDHDRLARSDTPVGLGATPGGEARYIAKLRQVANAALPGVLREILVKTGEALLDEIAKCDLEGVGLFDLPDGSPALVAVKEMIARVAAPQESAARA